ncbi:uncharacterized protein BX663DRAFT_527697 [Cokeromyces recurvatus]|uniref:uncharacterized protein n=1 Tax=Cokeromyces recurvatus TaxID=90255 RepID=UPI0022210735|nr:uncharacterized protein BX663DRAFT_527697 [Cokeromyces recurvatus]KAI7897614.1 hypothetical protein BX663DRAFT_527697 [Cokeromyces recurvatus]
MLEERKKKFFFHLACLFPGVVLHLSSYIIYEFFLSSYLFFVFFPVFSLLASLYFFPPLNKMLVISLFDLCLP